MSFDNIIGLHEIIKISSSILANKVGNRVVLNALENDLLHLFLGSHLNIRTKALLVFVGL
jgi:hypothetical protein